MRSLHAPRGEIATEEVEGATTSGKSLWLPWGTGSKWGRSPGIRA